MSRERTTAESAKRSEPRPVFSPHVGKCQECGKQFRKTWKAVQDQRLKDVRENGPKFAGTLEDSIDRITVCHQCKTGEKLHGEHPRW